jgi:hypothetical protein
MESRISRYKHNSLAPIGGQLNIFNVLTEHKKFHFNITFPYTSQFSSVVLYIAYAYRVSPVRSDCSAHFYLYILLSLLWKK